jgi:hypothetical protein
MGLMKLAALSTVASLMWAACSLAGPPPPAQALAAGKPVSLKVGESALAPDADLQVGFEGVTADSRCAKGAQCFWAGDATVRVWLRQGLGAKEFRELHTAAGKAEATAAGRHELRLLRLDPMPRASQTLAQADYVLTLGLSPLVAGQAER